MQKLDSGSGRLASPTSASSTDFLDELDVVRLRAAFPSEGAVVPKGATGTIVGVWESGELYEVEFLHPIAAVLTIPATVLVRDAP